MIYQNDVWPNKEEFDEWFKYKKLLVERLKRAREHKKSFHKTSRKIICPICKELHYAETENDII